MNTSSFPLDIQYDEENEIINMCKYSHLVFHENYETAAVFGALMMPTRGTLTILAIWKQSIQTTLDKTDQELPRTIPSMV